MSDLSNGFTSRMTESMGSQMLENSYRVVVADDHPVARRGLVLLLSSISNVEVCGQASNAREAIRVVKKTKPQMAVVGVNLNGIGKINAIRTIRTIMPKTEVLVVTLIPSSDVAHVAFRAGARAVVAKSDPPEELIRAVERVQKREMYVSGPLSTQLSRKLGELIHRDGRPDRELTHEEVVSPLVRAEFQIVEEFRKILVAPVTVAQHRDFISFKAKH